MSELRVRFLGQSGFYLTYNNSSILIDPNDKQSGDFEGELVYCTHKHQDHIGGVPTFLERNPKAVLLSNIQVAERFQEYSDRIVVVENGSRYQHGDWNLEFIQGKHGFYNDINLGVIIRIDKTSFAHCGDTITLEGFYSTKVMIFAIPISGFVTTSPGRALSELKKFQTIPSTIVLMHWLMRNPSSFCKKLNEEFPTVKCIIPEKGKLLPL